MTRAEVAQMFYNLLLDQDVEITKTFDDVPAVYLQRFPLAVQPPVRSQSVFPCRRIGIAGQ